MQERIRNFKMDNMRFVMIFLVVFGHLLEAFDGVEKDFLYNVIYTFHIPCLIFLTGYFSKFDRKKIFTGFMVLYFVFQYLYLMFEFNVLQKKDVLLLQYTTPYWILWYLLCIIFYMLLIPAFKTNNFKKACVIFGVSCVVSVLVGYEKTVGYYLALSRTIVYLPFFLAGYYAAHLPNKKQITDFLSKHKYGLMGICLAVIALGCWLIYAYDISKEAIFGSYSYVAAESNIYERILVGILAVAWIGFFLVVVPNRKIFGCTTIGQNTLSVYLLHAFVVGLIMKYNVLNYSQGVNILLSVAITMGMLLAFGNTFVGKMFKLVFIKRC